jgi:hypothetical protein
MLEDLKFSACMPSPFHQVIGYQDLKVLDKKLSRLDEQHLELQPMV